MSEEGKTMTSEEGKTMMEEERAVKRVRFMEKRDEDRVESMTRLMVEGAELLEHCRVFVKGVSEIGYLWQDDVGDGPNLAYGKVDKRVVLEANKYIAEIGDLLVDFNEPLRRIEDTICLLLNK